MEEKMKRIAEAAVQGYGEVTKIAGAGFYPELMQQCLTIAHHLLAVEVHPPKDEKLGSD